MPPPVPPPAPEAAAGAGGGPVPVPPPTPTPFTIAVEVGVASGPLGPVLALRGAGLGALWPDMTIVHSCTERIYRDQKRSVFDAQFVSISGGLDGE